MQSTINSREPSTYINFAMKLTLLILLFYFGLSTAKGFNSEFSECSNISENLERLECFDKVTERYDLKLREKSIEERDYSSEWISSIKLDPINDSKIITLSLLANSQMGSDDSKPLSLNIRCTNFETEAFIKWGTYVGIEPNVTLRIGSEKAVTREWLISTDGTATFYPRRVVNLIKRIMKENRLVARITPYMENPLVGVFNVTGLSKVIQPLRDTCSW